MTIIDDSTPVFLRGNGRPVTEERTITDLAVTGSLPAELDGRYVRNGANPLTGVADHPFFGDGMVHGVRLRDGKAEWYRNRYVQTPFIANPDLDILDPAVADGHEGLEGQHERDRPRRQDLRARGGSPARTCSTASLSTRRPDRLRRSARQRRSRRTRRSARSPVNCSRSGTPPSSPTSATTESRPTARMVQNEEITVNGPTMMHDFNITQHHVIFMDLPAVFDLEAAMRGEMPIHWDDNYPSRLGVMPRNGTDADVRWYDINPCYVFHPMNAYEDGDKIVLDVARLDHIWRDSMMDFPNPQFWRFTIDTTTGKVHEEQVDDRPGEFPASPTRSSGCSTASAT